MLLLSVLAGCTIHSGQLTTSVQVLPSTVPMDPNGIRVGPWVQAEGCDYVTTDLRVSDLIYQAQGDYDGLINVTVEAYEEYQFYADSRGRVLPKSLAAVGTHCFRVHGQAVRLTNPPERLPGAD